MAVATSTSFDRGDVSLSRTVTAGAEFTTTAEADAVLLCSVLAYSPAVVATVIAGAIVHTWTCVTVQ